MNYELEQKNPESSRTEIESRTELVTQMYKICHGAKIYKKGRFRHEMNLNGLHLKLLNLEIDFVIFLTA